MQPNHTVSVRNPGFAGLADLITEANKPKPSADEAAKVARINEIWSR